MQAFDLFFKPKIEFAVGSRRELHCLPKRDLMHLNEERALMKAATVVGILLIVLGVIGFAAGGISFTHQKKVVDAGPIQLSHKETSTLPISPILGIVSLIAGVGLVAVGVRNK